MGSMTTHNRLHILGLQVLAIVIVGFLFLLSGLRQTFAESIAPGTVPILDGTSLTVVSSSSTSSTTEITQSDVTNKGGTIMNSPIRVSTTYDVESYIRGVLKNDTRISKIESSSAAVSLTADNEPAKLMGFVNTTIPVTITANADGSISISHLNTPFLVQPAFDDQLRATAEILVGSSTKGAESLTPALQAQIITSLQLAIGSMRF